MPLASACAQMRRLLGATIGPKELHLLAIPNASARGNVSMRVNHKAGVPMIDADVFAFLERCDSYTSPAPLLEDLLQMAGNFGFTHLILSGVPMAGQRLAPMVELMGWPEGWFERYCQREYAKVDGVCLYSGQTTRPFYWHDVPDRLASTKASRLVANEATEFGIRSGFAVPFLSIHHWQSVVSFASPEPDCRMSDREKAQLVTMGTMAGAAVEALVYPNTPPPNLLTDREREVLLWAGAGKTYSEIGDILGIADDTVKKHLKNAREKLDVATTVQAVIQAARLRFISP